MDFKPNPKNILLGIVFFLLASFDILIPFFKFNHITTLQIIALPIILIISYILASVWIKHFSFGYLKRTPLGLKLIILFLLFKIYFLIGHIIQGFQLGNYVRDYLATNYLIYSIFPPLSIILLLTALVFLSINLKSNWIFGSLYFLFLLFSPLKTYMTEYFSGSLLAFFQTLFLGNPAGAILHIFRSLFPIIILIYLFSCLRNRFQSQKTEKIMLVVLIIGYSMTMFNIVTIFFGGRIQGMLGLIIQTIIFFGILLLFHYLSKKN